METKTNILVVGGAGYVGSHTVLALNEAGFSTIVFDNLSTGHRDAVFSDHFVEGDLFDELLLKETIQKYEIDAVVHFAALIEAGQSVNEPLKFYQNNVVGTLSLLNAMQQAQVSRIVFSSTAAVYGDHNVDLPLKETLPMVPINPYGNTKAVVEKTLMDIANTSASKSIALRYFNACGADPQGRTGERHEPETHLIPLTLQAAAGLREQITIFGIDYPTPDGTCIRDYIHVTDLALGHVAALNKLLNDEGAEGYHLPINLGTGTGYSVKEVIDVCKRVTNRDFSVVQSERRPGDTAQLIADISVSREVLNWQATNSSLDNIVRDAWNFMKSHAS